MSDGLKQPEEALGELPWDDLESRMGYRFKSRDLLYEAFVHESLVNESEHYHVSNERLEFLGDSVLGLAVADRLFKQYPGEPEGTLAQIKGYLVSRRHLAVCAERLKLERYLQLGKGEEHAGGKRRKSLQSNCLEAVLGAVYLDGGYSAARRVIHELLDEDFKSGLGAHKDGKTRLQEKVQTVFRALPEYRLVDQVGPPHDRTFEIEVWLAQKRLGSGEGQSKREAGQLAAKQALNALYAAGPEWYRPFLGSLKLQAQFEESKSGENRDPAD